MDCLSGSDVFVAQAAIDTYQQALQAAPSTGLFDRYIDFLTEQLEQHLQPDESANAETSPQTAPQAARDAVAAGAAAGRVLAAFEQAAAAGDLQALYMQKHDTTSNNFVRSGEAKP